MEGYRKLLGDFFEWCFWSNWAIPRVSQEFCTGFLLSHYAITHKKRSRYAITQENGEITHYANL